MSNSARKILVIDDTEANRYLVRRTLVHAGYDVAESATIAEGRTLLGWLKPDLIILDVKLPDGNGFAVCAELKANPATRFIPILMTSASFVQGQDRAYGLESGADGYLTTPYEAVELVANVKSLLRIREAEQALRKSEERFDLAMKGMNDGVWDWNLVTDEIYYGPRYKSMLGYNDDEYPNILASWVNGLHPDDKEKAQKLVEHYLNGSVPEYRNIFRLKHKNGEYRWIMSRASAVRDEQGKPHRMVGAHTDITELKELENELREVSEKAEAANRAKTEFLANMSHEIRTPMNAIIGLSHILATTSLTEKQKKFVDTLHLSADSLMGLINDMLDIAKIEDNMIELESIPFSLRELMQKVVSIMNVKADEKGLELNVEYAENVGDSFVGDPLRIQQILTNLTSNAIKFTSEGKINIAIDAHDSGLRDMQKLTIKVSDTGIGIPEEKLYSIFDKFTQADSSITRRYGGSGLGLTICKALIERMEGNIHVTSKPGQGTVFTINIPLKKGEALQKNLDFGFARKAKPLSASHQNALRVLLVEDYKANILVATTMLGELGCQYEVAVNGAQAIEKLAEKPFDVVLMDIQMQDMDGYEATRRIRKWEQEAGLQPLPIIAMTAHALMGDREKCLQAGMNDYISKPFDPIDLEQKLSVYAGAEIAA